MRLITYEQLGMNRVGTLHADHILDLNRALKLKLARKGVVNATIQADAELPTDIRAFIAGGDKTLETAREVIDWVSSQESSEEELVESGVFLSPAQIKIKAPVPRPQKIVCLGLNFRDHAIEGGDPIPDYPVYFPKYANCVIGPGESIIIPKVTDKVDYEVELAFIIGKRGRHIREADAMDYVFGYTVVNDVSAREYQNRSSQWAAGKIFDTFLPMGPHIVTADELDDPHDLAISCMVNDEVRQNSSTSEMIFRIPTIIEDLSAILTLEPGDVVSTGTPPGVGSSRKPPLWLQPGDMVSVEVEGIGVVNNPVVGEQVD